MSYHSEFMKNLNEYMNLKGITGKELAKVLDLSEASISYYKNGKREPQLSIACRIADYFEISLDELVGRKQY